MSLDIWLTLDGETVFEENYTHNLGKMADVAGIYGCIWRPEEQGFSKAGQLIPDLERGLTFMVRNSEKCKEFNPENGWGSYDSFLPWVVYYLEACRKYPEALIEVSR